jgi:hypothetical protein
MSARLMTMRIRQGGHMLKLKHLDHEGCTVYGKRTDTGEDMEASYTFQEAKEAGLVKQDGNWMKFRQDMLWARAISRLARRLFPDVIGTAYVEGEILEMIPTQSETKIFPAETEGQIVSPSFEEVSTDFNSLLPQDVDKTILERYVTTCAEHFKQSEEEFKAAIVSNGQMGDFLKAFHAWAVKHPTQPPPQAENAPQSAQKLSEPLEKEGNPSDPWQNFRHEFVNLRYAGFSSWIYKNRDRLAQAPDQIRAEAKQKWGKLYSQNPWPLDPPEAQAEETATMFPQEEPATNVDPSTGEILQVACPERDGKDVDIQQCQACSMRNGCPSWEGE